VHALKTIRLDCCNALLFGLPKVEIAKLQGAQNAAARLILGFGKFYHLTPVLYEMYWLPVSLCIDYKILLSTFKCIYCLGPTYLSSSDWTIPRETTSEARPFSAAAPKLWNGLAVELCQATSLDSVFRSSFRI